MTRSRSMTFLAGAAVPLTATAIAGDTNGEGLNAFGGRWYAVSAAGNQVTRAPSSSGSASGY